jgi:ribonuclease E
VEKVFPSLQAVFVKYKATGKNGFLPFAEIDPNYLSNNILNHDLVEGEFIDTELLSYSVKSEADGVNFDEIDDKSIQSRGFICTNQPIIVQVIKEERGTKGAMLSTFIYLDGQYCTFVPNRSDKTGLAQNTLSLVEKKRLQVLLQNLEIPEHGSVVIEEAGFSASMNEVSFDLQNLIEIWDRIKKKACEKNDLIDSTQKVLYYDFNLVKDVFCDKGGMYFHSIIIDSVKIYQEAMKFLKNYMPHFLNLVKLHDEIMPVFSSYGIEKLINNELNNIVSLKSGGYIVINITEALVAVDVNSGKNRDEMSIEETALKTNLEAIQEILQQVKLRKLSGLIVVDLIGMREYENNKAVEGIARRIAHSDKSKIQISIVSEFSILIISKQRLERNLNEIRNIKCPSCDGFGFVKNIKFSVYEIFNEIRFQFSCEVKANFKIIGGNNIIELLMNECRQKINDLEDEVKAKISLHFDSTMIDNEYIIEKIVISQSTEFIEKRHDAPIKNFSDIIINEEVFPDENHIEIKSYNLVNNSISAGVMICENKKIDNLTQHSKQQKFIRNSDNISHINKKNQNTLANEKFNYENFSRKMVNNASKERRSLDKSTIITDNDILQTWNEWINFLEGMSL